jgi:hypothetical protein
LPPIFWGKSLVLKNRFLVLNAEARFHVLGKVTLLGYSE